MVEDVDAIEFFTNGQVLQRRQKANDLLSFRRFNVVCIGNLYHIILLLQV